jgi:nucleoid-associated protein YgaU
MSKPQLEKATITTLAGTKVVIPVLFNPTEYSIDRSNAYKATPIPGLGSPILQFVNGECDQLTMELFLDDYTDPDGPTSREKKEKDPVAKRLKDIAKLLEIDPALHAPPPVRFNWGPMEFQAVIEKLGRKFTKFHPDGTPARATLNVSFKEYRTLGEQLRTPRRESADKTKRRRVIGQESLWSIAAREYSDEKEWVRIAIENDLDDPREIKAGDWLRLPPIESSNGTFDAF